MLTAADLVTLDAVPGYRVVRDLGRIAARAARPRNRLRDAMLGFRAFVGMPSLEFLSEAERARREALELLLERGVRLGAHAVIGLRFRVARARDGGTHVMVMGRGVLLDPEPLSPAPPPEASA